MIFYKSFYEKTVLPPVKTPISQDWEEIEQNKVHHSIRDDDRAQAPKKPLSLCDQ